MRVDEFDYTLPRERIALYPCVRREQARLCVVDRTRGSIQHRDFFEIGSFFRAGDTLVLNDTKVLPCRLLGKRASGGKVEIVLLAEEEALRFRALIRPGRLKSGEEVIFNNGSLRGRITARHEITFSCGDAASVYAHGVMPLPPYIKRDPGPSDFRDYQTVYARHDGSVAAPTAGLHFSQEIMEQLTAQGMVLAYITLHVGYGTFRSVTAQEVAAHRMEEERFSVPPETLRALARAQKNGNRVCAVGTTSCRTLETYALSGAAAGATDLFIYPGFTFRRTDMLLTNFHLPRSTLFMLACAFGGTELMRRAYAEAIEREYRFYSYGDAMLII